MERKHDYLEDHPHSMTNAECGLFLATFFNGAALGMAGLTNEGYEAVLRGMIL